MFVKLTSGFLLPAQLIRNLVLQDFSVTGSKSCKPEVTFAIHLLMLNLTTVDKIIQANLEKLKICLNRTAQRYSYTSEGFSCGQEGGHLLATRKKP